MNLEENIKKWVTLDNQQKKINDEVKKLRDEKNEISKNIFNYCSENNIESPTINISDGKLNFVNQKQANIMSYKFLEDCFKLYFSDERQAEELLTFIKEKRIYTNSLSIKRFYNN
tara:strand:- start:523 stop:867 length:345 start_codon:yes stop_codon:yes gene_type:complete